MARLPLPALEKCYRMLEDVQSSSGRKINIVVNGVKDPPAEGFVTYANREQGGLPGMSHTRSLLSALLLFLFCISGPLQAQKDSQNESLLIGPGDLLHLQVYDTPEMDQRARVTDAGTIPFSFLGDVHVAGLTPAAAAAEIDHRLVGTKVMLHPQVMVRVEGLCHPERVGDGPGAEAGAFMKSTLRAR